MQQKTDGDIPDMQGTSQSIWEEVKATAAVYGFAQGMTLNEPKGQEETPRPGVAQADSAEGPRIQSQAAKWLGLSCTCVMLSEGSSSWQEQWAWHAEPESAAMQVWGGREYLVSSTQKSI